jgi:excisionase family DNA binding protein
MGRRSKVTKIPPETAQAQSYNLHQVAAITGLGRTTLYEMIKRGKLVARKVGVRTIVLQEDLAAFLHGLERVQ